MSPLSIYVAVLLMMAANDTPNPDGFSWERAGLFAAAMALLLIGRDRPPARESGR